MANWIFKPRRDNEHIYKQGWGGKAARFTVNANSPFQGSLSKCFSPSEWKCVKGSFSFASRGLDHEFAIVFFFHTPHHPLTRQKESAWASLLSNCIRLRPPSPFNSKAEQLVAFIFNPGDITFHRIPLGPPNPLWSISFVLMRLLLHEARRYRNIQSWNYHLALVSHYIICPEEINRKRSGTMTFNSDKKKKCPVGIIVLSLQSSFWKKCSGWDRKFLWVSGVFYQAHRTKVAL